MPEFIPQHTPANLDSFAKGYLDAFEWVGLQDQEPKEGDYIDRDKIRGWSRDALRRIKRECREFAKANEADLKLYYETYKPSGGHDVVECAGHDFYLTREGHGAGFWDRGRDSVFQRLADAARQSGPAGYAYLSRGWLRID